MQKTKRHENQVSSLLRKMAERKSAGTLGRLHYRHKTEKHRTTSKKSRKRACNLSRRNSKTWNIKIHSRLSQPSRKKARDLKTQTETIKKELSVKLGNRSSQHNFAMVPNAQIPRSKFNRSFGRKQTFDADYLVPVFVDEVLPGDTFNLSLTSFARLAPLYRDWETDRKSTRLNSSHSAKSRMPSSA